MTPDELKSIPKGSFVVMKTGTHPMRTKLRLFLDWGITFGAPYITPEHAARPVAYASRQELSHRAKTVYMYLKDRSNADGTCWPSVRRIAADLKLSRRTVQRALSDLEHHGFLERTHRRRPNGSLTSNFYRLK